MFCLSHVSPNLSSIPCSAEFVDNFGFLIWFESKFIILCLLILWCIFLLVWFHICVLDPYKFIYIYSIVFLKFLILFLNSRIRITLFFFKFCAGCFFVMNFKYVGEKLWKSGFIQFDVLENQEKKESDEKTK